jgi:ferredoxin
MIFYFSATGNSRYVAEMLAGRLGDRAVSIVDRMSAGFPVCELSEGEKVGIVTPVYFYGLPLNVEEFISKMSFDRKPYLYLVLTFGTYTATTAKQASRQISAVGLKLNSSFSVKMPETYIPLFRAPDDCKEKKILRNADPEVERIAAAVSSGAEGDFDNGKGAVPALITGFSRPFYIHGRSTRRFRSTGGCIGCGQCAEICPSRAIEIRDGRPVWVRDRCLRCMACLHRCPEKAIEFGRVTVGRKRYVNPNVIFK